MKNTALDYYNEIKFDIDIEEFESKTGMSLMQYINDCMEQWSDVAYCEDDFIAAAEDFMNRC